MDGWLGLLVGTYQPFVFWPSTYWALEQPMLDVHESCPLGPALQVFAWRAAAAQLVTGAIEHLAEFDKLVVFVRTPIFAITIGVEVLELNPAAGS